MNRINEEFKTKLYTASGHPRVLVALSGGVDSSVAAALLKRQGYGIEAAYMRCWSTGPYCTADQDQADAAAVAAILGIPFHIFDFEKQYQERVMDYFFKEYKAGRTPNPDVVCNKEIKFGLFLEKARELGFDYIATGHYARVSCQEQETRSQRPAAGDQATGDWNLATGSYHLLAGVDREKDQSYFLYLLNQEQLAHSIFPLGELTKKEVRNLAKRFGLPTADKPDSTGICFIGEAPMKEFLRQKIKISHGNIVSVDGKLLGRHIGLPFYTIGQREGLGFSAPVPYYVVDKDIANNRLIVAPFGHEALFKDKFLANGENWVAGVVPHFPLKVQVKLRYRAENAPATVKRIGKESLEVNLDQKERAITPGQSAVFYQGEEVLGGAVIGKVMD